MATSATTLIQRIRRFLGDWPELDSASASITNSGTSLTVADSSRYAVNWAIQIDQEMLRVSALPDATHLTVVRGIRGTTAASHASSTTILVKPQFSDQEILDAINAGINATFPYFYKPVIDTSLTGNGVSYEFTVPTGLTWLSKVENKNTGALDYAPLRDWTVKRAASPILQFTLAPEGSLRLHGYGPFPQLTGFTDSLDTMWPAWGDDPLVEYASQRLLMSSESQRVRLDAGPQDDAQAPPRQGVGASIAGQLLQRFQMRLNQSPMPPLPPHIVRII